MSDQVMDMFWRMPPVSRYASFLHDTVPCCGNANPVPRTVSASALILSLAVHMGLLPGYRVIFHVFYIWKFPPELWRVPTSFLLTGSGLGLLFDTYFLYKYLSELEIANRRFPKKEDLIWYLFCVSAGILVSHSRLLRVKSLRPYPRPQSPALRRTPHLSARIVSTHSYSGS